MKTYGADPYYMSDPFSDDLDDAPLGLTPGGRATWERCVCAHCDTGGELPQLADCKYWGER